MKLDQHDVAAQQRTLTDERDDALNHIDHAVDYLQNRSDFSDRRALIHAAAHLFHSLECLASLQAWGDWNRITLDVIAQAKAKGETPTMAATVERLQRTLLQRLSVTRPSPTALSTAFMTLVTNEYAGIISTCQQLIAAEAITQDVCATVATGMGLTQAEVWDRLKSGDPLIGKAVGRCAFMRTVEKCVQEGITLPNVPPQLLQHLGIDPSEIPESVRPKPPSADDFARSLASTLGLDPSAVQVVDSRDILGDTRASSLGGAGMPGADIERRVPRFIPPGHGNGADHNEGIKVG